MSEQNSSKPALSDLGLLRIMILKEVRSTFRERSQMLGLVFSMIMLASVLGIKLIPAMRNAHAKPAATTELATTQPATTEPATTQLATPVAAQTPPTSPSGPPRRGDALGAAASMLPKRWIALGVVAMAGFFFSSGYLLAAVLATFVGEKESRTLEILLACPVSDLKLYSFKCISVLLPAMALGAFFSAATCGLLLVLVPDKVAADRYGLMAIGLLLGTPILCIVQSWFVGIGAAISARTETMKGAGQLLALVFVALIMIITYGIPMLITQVPGMTGPAGKAIGQWIQLGFTWQYLTLLAVLAVPAIVFLAIGRVSFQRNRMLT